MDTIIQIWQLLHKYIIGALFGVITLFLSGFAKEYFNERERVAKHRQNVARHVLKICNEASTGNYNSDPRNYEHVNSILTNVEGIDAKVEDIFNKFVTNWRLLSQRSANATNNKEISYRASLLKDIEEERKKLILWGNKIVAGK